MSEAYFGFVPNPDRDLMHPYLTQTYIVRYRSSDGTVSAPLASIQTADKQIYTLTPDAKKPWFELVDRSGNTMFGYHHNHPKHRSLDLVRTPGILRVTTVRGHTIITALEMARDPRELVTNNEAQSPLSFKDTAHILNKAFQEAMFGLRIGEEPPPPKRSAMQPPQSLAKLLH